MEETKLPEIDSKQILVKYPITEIFDSVQGEGSWIGIPATFIRLSGCNLRCDWCDTKGSWEQGRLMSIKEIVDKIKKKTIIITGGEPTIYDLKPLVNAIKNALKKNDDTKIAIETNGTNEISAPFDRIVCSPKPDAKYIIKCNPDELKYVVDQKFTVDVIPDQYKGKIPIWLQPNAEDLKNSMKKCYELVMQYDYLRLGLQLHKFYEIR